MTHLLSIPTWTARYDFGVLGAVTAIAIISSLLSGELVRLGRYTEDDFDYVLLALNTTQLSAAVISCIACASFPRRPDLTFLNSPVDGQYTVPALWRYTFSWPSRMLKVASSKPDFDFQDIPLLHLGMRSVFLEPLFSLGKDTPSLIKRLLLAHWRELVFQFFFAICMSIVGFAPQLAMFGLLNLIEARDDRPDFYMSAWILVVGLGTAILIEAWSQAWNHWIVFSRLGLPIRTELSATIFAKAMRRKDIKGVAQSEDVSDKDSIDSKNGEGSSLKGGAKAEDGEENVQKTRQATINLVVSGVIFLARECAQRLFRVLTRIVSMTSPPFGTAFLRP